MADGPTGKRKQEDLPPRIRATPLVTKHAEKEAKLRGKETKGKHRKEDK
jgi:hypothetical protein